MGEANVTCSLCQSLNLSLRKNGMLHFRLTLFAAACLAVTLPASADWRQFRGNDSSGVVADADLPVDWVDGDSPKNIAWKIALPGRGLSSPIVVGDKVVVTCSSGFQQDRLHVLTTLSPTTIGLESPRPGN